MITQRKPIISTVLEHGKYLVSVRLEAEMNVRWFHGMLDGSTHDGITYSL